MGVESAGLPFSPLFHLAGQGARQMKQLQGLTLCNKPSLTCGFIYKVSWMNTDWMVRVIHFSNYKSNPQQIPSLNQHLCNSLNVYVYFPLLPVNFLKNSQINKWQAKGNVGRRPCILFLKLAYSTPKFGEPHNMRAILSKSRKYF